jgi:hypothetical protein
MEIAGETFHVLAEKNFTHLRRYLTQEAGRRSSSFERTSVPGRFLFRVQDKIC